MKIKEQQNGEIEDNNLPQEVADQNNSVDDSRRNFTKAGLAVSGVLLTLASRSALAGGTGGRVCKTPSAFCSANHSQHGKPHSGGGYDCKHWIDNCKSWVGCVNSDNFSKHFSCDTSSHWGKKIVYSWQSGYSSWGYKSGSGTTYSQDSRATYIPFTLYDILCSYHVGHNPSGTNSPCKVTKDSYGNPKNNWYTSGTCSDYSSYQPIPCTPGSLDELGKHCVKALLNCKANLTPYCTETTVKAIFNDCRSKGFWKPTSTVTWTVSQCIDYLKSTENCDIWS